MIDISSPNFELGKTILKIKWWHKSQGIAICTTITAANFVEIFSLDISCNSLWMLAMRICLKGKEGSLTFLAVNLKNFQANYLRMHSPFHCIMHYFAIVKLPSKLDYLQKHTLLAVHSMCYANIMTRTQFELLWRHWRCAAVDERDMMVEEDDEEADAWWFISIAADALTNLKFHKDVFFSIDINWSWWDWYGMHADIYTKIQTCINECV